ncbi:hypothetical protein ACNI3T_00440 [Christiangramia sp. ASW11-125]|uniref:hypothetical protein n=1 Tax=Christiangramia sp. ASW11-125 TaxID=3400701 RepID=UPI003AAD6098
MKVSSNDTGNEYILDIYRSSENSKIYFLKYTGEQKYNKADKERIEELWNKKDRKAAENKELNSIHDRSQIFTKECFNYSAKDSIIKISDSIVLSKADILSEIERNKNRVVIHGIQIEVTIETNDGVEYSYHVHAPDKDHYKLFEKFVDESSKEFKVFQYHDKY